MNAPPSEPWVNTIRAPIKTMVMIKGANQYFLRTLIKKIPDVLGQIEQGIID